MEYFTSIVPAYNSKTFPLCQTAFNVLLILSLFFYSYIAHRYLFTSVFLLILLFWWDIIRVRAWVCYYIYCFSIFHKCCHRIYYNDSCCCCFCFYVYCEWQNKSITNVEIKLLFNAAKSSFECCLVVVIFVDFKCFFPSFVCFFLCQLRTYVSSRRVWVCVYLGAKTCNALEKSCSLARMSNIRLRIKGKCRMLRIRHTIQCRYFAVILKRDDE